MANHEIPRRAQRIETIFGITADGNVAKCVVFEHHRRGHEQPMYFVLQYAEVNRRIDRDTRQTNQLSGPGAGDRLDAELAETRAMFEATRIAAAKAGPR